MSIATGAGDMPHTMIAFAVHVREVRAELESIAAALADGDERLRESLWLLADSLWF